VPVTVGDGHHLNQLRDRVLFFRPWQKFSLVHVLVLTLEGLDYLLGRRVHVLGLDLAPAVEAAAWAGHHFNVVVAAFFVLDVPDDVLNVSEAIGLCKSKNHLAVD